MSAASLSRLEYGREAELEGVRAALDAAKADATIGEATASWDYEVAKNQFKPDKPAAKAA